MNAEIDTLVAQRRADSGSNSAAKLRQAHQVPGVLFSLPDEESILLTFEQKEIATCLQKLGRTGWACHVFNVKVPPEDGAGEPAIYRALVSCHTACTRTRALCSASRLCKQVPIYLYE